MNDVTRTSKERLRRLPGIEGCSDHGCIFGHPGGMGTNGSCVCEREIRSPDMRRRIRKNIELYRTTIAALGIAIEKGYITAHEPGALRPPAKADIYGQRDWWMLRAEELQRRLDDAYETERKFKATPPPGVVIRESDAKFCIAILRGAMTFGPDCEVVWRRIQSALTKAVE